MRSQAELDRLFDALDVVYFDGGMRARGFQVRWRKFRKTKQFYYGRIYFDKKLVVVNRVLARPEVPAFVLMGTLIHEQLHAVIGPDHDHAFKMAEMRYVHHTACNAWEAEYEPWLRQQEP